MNRKPDPLPPSRGFTLIELLVVITVIAILAGIVLNTAGYIQKKAARSRAEAEIAALSAALESYKADMGDYPRTNTSTSSGNNSFLRAALAPDGANALNSLNKVYFEFSKGMGTNSTLSRDTNEVVIDPFGNRYGYQYPGNATRSGTNFFDLWSTGGANPATDTNQWIKNW